MNRTATLAIGFAVAALAFLLYGSGWRLHAPQGDPSSQHDSLTASVVDVLSVEDPLDRAGRLVTTLQGFGPAALDEVREAWILIVGERDSAAVVELALLVEWWSRHDPEGAFRWLQQRKQLSDATLSTALIRSWATRDPMAASVMLDTLPPGLRKQMPYIGSALVLGWNASGRSGVEGYLMTHPSETVRQTALTALTKDKVRREGVEETIRWAEALPDDAANNFKLRAFGRVASAVARVDPLRAAAWTESQLDGEWGSGLPRRVAISWAPQDGPAAMAWLRSLHASGASHLYTAVEEAYRAWMREDREAAHAWLREQELDASLDAAIAVYAASTTRDDPEVALSWATRVQDDIRRDEAQEKVARYWLFQDSDAARAWIETSDLSENARERLYAAKEKAEEERAQNAKRQSRRRAATGS